MPRTRLGSLLWLLAGAFVWSTACGSSNDDSSANTTSAVASTGVGGSSASSNTGTTNTSATGNVNNNNNNNNSGTGTTGNDVLMHDDSECDGEDPVDGGDCDIDGLVCDGEDGSQCVCGSFGPAGQWNCLDFTGGGGQSGAGGEGGAG